MPVPLPLRIKKWMIERIGSAEEETPLRGFVCSRARQGSKKKDLVCEKAYHDGVVLEELALEIVDHAQEDATVLGGHRGYFLRAMYGTEDMESMGGSFPFKLTGEEVDEDIEEDDANASSLTAQAQNQVRSLMTGFNNMVVTFMESMDKKDKIILAMAQGSMQRADQQETRAGVLFGQLVDANDRKAERELTVRRELRRDERIDQAIKLVMTYAPLYFADKTASPSTALQMTIDQLTPDELAKVMEGAPPRLLPQLFKIVEERLAMIGADEAKQKSVKELGDRMIRGITPPSFAELAAATLNEPPKVPPAEGSGS